MTLSDDQRTRLQQIAQDESVEADLRRNAHILLRYADGAETRDIARDVGLSESRTRFWRKVFERHGIRMFEKGFVPERRASTTRKGNTAPVDSDSIDSGDDHPPAHPHEKPSGTLLTDEDAARLRALLDERGFELIGYNELLQEFGPRGY